MATSSSSSEQWSEHGVSSPLEVRESPRWGRGVYTAAALSPGVEVMRAEPLVHVLSNDVRGQLCDYCLKESESLSKCGRCKFVRYCSKACQRGDWRWHVGECRGIARARPHSPTPLVRLIVRCLHVQTEGKVQRQTELLCSSEEKLSLEVKEKMATLMCGVRLLLEKTESAALQRAHVILCKALCNTFTIHGPGLDPIGAALYVGPSLLNHSCLPNCVAVFAGSGLAVRTIAPIKLGDQLLVSYVDLLDCRVQRNKTLVRSYGFSCECRRCLTELDPGSPFQSMYAAVEGSSAESVREAADVGMSALSMIEGLRRKGDCEHMLSECEASLSRQALVLGGSHHVTIHTLRQLVYACIAVGDWPKAIQMSRKLTDPLKLYLPEYHPVLGVHWTRLGKLLRVSGTTAHLRLSVVDLTQAVRQLRVGYGSDHASTLEALQMLHDSQTELRHRGIDS